MTVIGSRHPQRHPCPDASSTQPANNEITGRLPNTIEGHDALVTWARDAEATVAIECSGDYAPPGGPERSSKPAWGVVEVPAGDDRSGAPGSAHWSEDRPDRRVGDRAHRCQRRRPAAALCS